MDPSGYRVGKDYDAARKVQKADREKLRRDRLNEQFLELGNALDPARPKNDKATILSDAIQMLKDLTAQVNRMKVQYNALSEESHELIQEKNELREEKAKLKSEVGDLNAQYQQRLRVLHPWTAVDPSLAMHSPLYAFSMPIHRVQPFPFSHNPGHGTISNPYSCGMPYSSPCHPQVEKSLNQHISQNSHKVIRSQTSSHQDSRKESSDHDLWNYRERNNAFNDVATELELKTPGSTVCSQSKSANDLDTSSETRKGKQRPQQKRTCAPTGSSSCRCSSSCSSLGDNSTDGIGDGSVSRISDV